MGDMTTHAILHHGYWFLVYRVGNDWVDSRNTVIVCPYGSEDLVKTLSPFNAKD